MPPEGLWGYSARLAPKLAGNVKAFVVVLLKHGAAWGTAVGTIKRYGGHLGTHIFPAFEDRELGKPEALRPEILGGEPPSLRMTDMNASVSPKIPLTPQPWESKE